MSGYNVLPDPNALNFEQVKKRLAETDDRKAVARLRKEGWREASHSEYGEPLWLPPTEKK